MSESIVMKFGGTSVGSPERINAVAERVTEHIARTGDSVVVVVSAMSGETNRLIGLGEETLGESVSPRDSRELSQLLASGEMVSSALTSLAIQARGHKSNSLMAHQVEMKTKRSFGQDLIQDVNVDRIRELLSEGVVPVVCGFQGIDEKGDFTLLGRGGSDTTAVAIAAALDRSKCFILTDIDGVYSALPKLCPKAKKLDYLTYEEMLEMANSGAKVLQSRSVSLARTFKVPFFVCSSFNNSPGTEIVESYKGMEEAVVSGITCRTDEAKLTLREIPDEPGHAAAVLSALAETGIVVDMIVQSQGEEGKAELSLTIPREDTPTAQAAILKLIESDFPTARFDVDDKLGINIELITTSEIKISVALAEQHAEKSVQALHKIFVEDQ